MHADGALGAGLVRFVLAGRQAHCKCIWTTITLGGIFNGQFCQDLERYNGRAGTAAHRMVGFVAPVNTQEMANQRGVEQECTLSVHFILIRVLCHRFLMSLFSVCRSERLVTPVKETASVHAMKMAILRSTTSAR